MGHEEVAPDQLLANPKNWRVHPQQQQDAMTGVLEQVGFVQDVIVNRTTGHVVDGHLRVAIALKRGEATIPVKYVELTGAEEDLILATFDPLSGLAATDTTLLHELLRETQTDDADVRRMLDTLAEEAEITTGDATLDREAMLLDQAVQLKPGREFVVIIAEPGEEWEQLRAALDLKLVRRGGYKPGSEFDQVSVQRTVKAGALLERLATTAQ